MCAAISVLQFNARGVILEHASICTLNAFNHAVGESHTIVRSEEADNLLDIV